MAARSKGASNRARNGLGQSSQAGRPSPISARFGPDFLLVASHVIPYLCALTCGPLMLFALLLSLGCFVSKLHYFLVESLKICMLTLRSSGHLESCSSCALTLVGLHDLLSKCLRNISQKCPL
jgi:hypothetical protein